MNKNELKKVVKERIYNQKAAIQNVKWDEVQKMAKQFFDDHFPVEAEKASVKALFHMDEWQRHFRKEFGSTRDMHGMGSAMSYINNSQDATFNLVRGALKLASSGTDPLTSISHYWLRESPLKNDFLELCAEVKAKFHDSMSDLNKLEFELLSVISAAKSAKVAHEQLEELGITLDVPEAKKVQSNLPAVVKLSVDPKLFNKDVAKEQ